VVTRTFESRFNQVKTITDQAGQLTTYTYDYELLNQGNAGKLMRVEYPDVPDENGILSTPTVTYTYNSLGLLAATKDVRGTVTRYAYTQGGSTPPGLLTKVIEDYGGLNYTTVYTNFDAAGHAQTVIYPGEQRTSAYTFDLAGRVTSETNAEGIVTRYEYDERGQLARKVATPENSYCGSVAQYGNYISIIRANVFTGKWFTMGDLEYLLESIDTRLAAARDAN
jgi:YD repeat-containing protein